MVQALCSDSRPLRANAALYAVPAVLDVDCRSLSVLLAELLDSSHCSHKVGLHKHTYVATRTEVSLAWPWPPIGYCLT